MKQTDYNGLKAEMAEASTPLVIDLHAPWCSFCKKTMPHLERLSSERDGAIRFVGLDTDEDPEAYDLLGVKTLPCIVLMKDGVEVARRGSGDYDQITAWLAESGL